MASNPRTRGGAWKRDHPGERYHKPFTSKTDGPFCDAKLDGGATGRTCRNPAGYRTEHLGQGRCYLHGGCVPVMTTGRYSKILHKSVREKFEMLSAVEMDVMDLAPEAQLLRALIVDFINRYEDFHEALLAWYADSTGKSSKPRKVLDLADAARLIEGVSRVVHRIHQIRSTGAITLATFQRVTEQMGIIVAKHVLDAKILEQIEHEWMTIAVDAKSIMNDTDVDDSDI